MKKSEIIKKYSDIYRDIPEKNKKKAEELIDKLSDVLIMMQECKEHLDSEGCVTEMCQGSYTIERESPWSRTYDSKVKLMLSITDKLDKMLPDSKTEGVAKAGENLAKLVAGGRPVELR